MHAIPSTAGAQDFVGLFSQAQAYKADLNFSKTSLSEYSNSNGSTVSSTTSVVSISLSVVALNVTSGYLASEQVIEDTAPTAPLSEHRENRAKGLEKALQETLKEIQKQFGSEEGIKVSTFKKFFKQIHALNAARGDYTPLGHLDQESRKELRIVRLDIRSFFQEESRSNFGGDVMSRFLDLQSKLEKLHNFALTAQALLKALAEGDEEEDDQGGGVVVLPPVSEEGDFDQPGPANPDQSLNLVA